MAEREVVWKALADFSSIVREAAKAKAALADLDAAQRGQHTASATEATKKKTQALSDLEKTAARGVSTEKDATRAQDAATTATKGRTAATKAQNIVAKDANALEKEAIAAKKLLAEATRSETSLKNANIAAGRSELNQRNLSTAATRAETAAKKAGREADTEALRLIKAQEDAHKKVVSASRDRVAALRDANLAGKQFNDQTRAGSAAMESHASSLSRASAQHRNYARDIKASRLSIDELTAHQKVYTSDVEEADRAIAKATERFKKYEKALKGSDRWFAVGGVPFRDMVKYSDAYEKATARRSTANLVARKAQDDLTTSMGLSNKLIAEAQRQSVLVTQAKKVEAASQEALNRAVGEHAITLRNQERAQGRVTDLLIKHGQVTPAVTRAETELAKAQASHLLSTSNLTETEKSHTTVVRERTITEHNHTAALNRATTLVHEAESASKRLAAARQSEAVATNHVTATMEKYFKSIGERAQEAGAKMSAMSAGVRWSAIFLGIFGGLIPIVISALGQLSTMLTSVAAGFMGMVGTLVSAVGVLGTLPALIVGIGSAVGVMVLGITRTLGALKLYTAAQKQAAGASTNTAKTMQTNARSIRDAEYSLAGAQKQVQKSQDALTKARADAAQQIVDLRKQIKQLALDEESSSQSVESARLALQKAINDPGSTDLERRQAELAVREAEARLSDVKDQQQSGADNLTKLQQQGIEGSDGVVSALENQQSAIEALTRAQENLADTQKNVSGGAAAASSSLNQYDAAMAKMTPEAKAVVLQLIAMSGAFRGIQTTAERGLMPGVLVFLRNLQTALPIVDAFVGAVALIGGDMMARLGAALGSKSGLGGLKALFTSTLPIVQNFADIFVNLLKTFGNIAIAGGPLTTWLTRTMKGWTDYWAAATSGVDGQNRLSKYFDGARNSISLISTAIWNLLQNFGTIASALKPIGDMIWKAIGDTAKRWDDFNKSLAGQNALKAWGDNALSVLTQLWGILGDIGSAMVNVFGTDDITPFLKVVRSDLGPAIRDMFSVFTGSQGQTIASGIAHIVEGLAKLFGNPDYVKGVAILFRGVGDALKWLGTQGSKLTPAILFLLAAVTGSKVAFALLGPVISVTGGIFNFFTKNLGNGVTAFGLLETRLFGVARSFGFVAAAADTATESITVANLSTKGFTQVNTTSGLTRVADAFAGIGKRAFGVVKGFIAAIAPALIFIAVVGAGLVALRSLMNALATPDNLPGIDQATKALEKLNTNAADAKSGVDDIFKDPGGGWGSTDLIEGVNSLDTALNKLGNKTWYDDFRDFIFKTFTNAPGQIDLVTERFKQLDTALTNMKAKEAALAFAKIAATKVHYNATWTQGAKDEALGVEKLLEMYPQYKAKLQATAEALGIMNVSNAEYVDWMGGKIPPAVSKAADAAAAAGGDMTQYKDAMDETTKATQRLVSDQDKATDAINRTADAALNAADSSLAYQDSLASATKTAADNNAENSKNGNIHDKNSIAYKQNQKALIDLARQSKATLQDQANLGLGSEEVAKKMAVQRAEWLKTAAAMGYTIPEAEAMATAWGLVPTAIKITPEVQDAEAKKKLSDLQIAIGQLPPSQQVYIESILHDKGIDEAYAALAAINNKTATVTVTVQYDAVAGALNQQRGAANAGRKAADGAIFKYYEDGGTESHVAQIAPAGAWRVWAEPETGGESYIPLAPAKRERSVSIWRQTGKLLGQFANGGITRFASGGVSGATSSSSSGNSFDTVAAMFSSLSASVSGTWGSMWDGVLSRMSASVSKIALVGNAFVDQTTSQFTGMFAGLSTMFAGFQVTVGTAFSNVYDAVRSPISSIITKVINPFVDGFNALASKIPGVPTLGHVADLPARAGGGMIYGPGTPTSDSILGVDASGVPTARVSRDEYVVNAASTRKHRALIEAINSDRLPGHAAGGLVSYKGGTFTTEFAKRLAFAEQLSKENFQIAQGGFRPRTSYSGTSHQGDAVDISSPVNPVTVRALRQAGIAAWDRTGTGNWISHIHGVPLPGAGDPEGSAIWQGQDYIRGGNGLGGRDTGSRPAINPLMALGAAISGGGWLNLDLASLFKPFSALKDVGTDFMSSPFGQLASGMINSLKDGLSANLNNWFGLELPFTSSAAEYGTEGVPVAVGTSGREGFSTPSAFAMGGLISAAKSGRGYARGTTSASPGWRWAGENGPELVHFAGGESVVPTQALANGGVVLAGDSSSNRMPVYLQALQNMMPGVASKSIMAIQKMLTLFDPILYSGSQNGMYNDALSAAIQTLQKRMGANADGLLSSDQVQKLANLTNSGIMLYTGSDVDLNNDVITQSTRGENSPAVAGAYTGFFRTADAAIYGMLPDGSSKWMSPTEWASLGQPWDKVFSDAYGTTQNPDIANAFSEQMRSNALTTEFNSYQDTYTQWGLDYLVENFKNKGAADSLTLMRQLIKNRPSATTYNAMLKASGLALADTNGNDTPAKRQLFINAIANGTNVGLQGASKAAGVSLDTGASFFDAITSDGGWGAISMSKLQRVVGDVNDFKQLFKFARFAEGGFIGGSGSGDTEAILATPHEFMIRKAAADTLGPEVLNYLNNIDRMPKFSGGGFIGGYNAPAVSGFVGALSGISSRSADTTTNGKATSNEFNFTINNPVAEKSSVSTQKAILNLGRRGLLDM